MQHICRYSFYLIISLVFSLASLFQATAQQVVNDNYLLFHPQLNIHFDDLYPNGRIKANSTAVLDSIYNLFHEGDCFLENEIVEAQKVQIKKQNGLSFNISTNHNLKAAADEDLEPSSKTRIRAGLDFDLLNNGIADKRNQLKILENEKQLLELNESQLGKKKAYAAIYNSIIYLSNRNKIKLLNKRFNQLNAWLEKINEMHYSHLIPLEQVLKYSNNLSESKNTIFSYRAFNHAFQQMLSEKELKYLNSIEELPMVDINLDSLLRLVEIHDASSKKAYLQEENLFLKQKLGNEYRLKLSTRWNYNSSIGSQKALTYPSIAMSFSMPLYSHAKTKNTNYLKRDKLQNQLAQDQFNLKKELLNHYYEYRYTLKQYTNYQYLLAIEQEKSRVSQAQKESINTRKNEINLMQHKDNLLAIELEIEDLKQQLHLNLLKIHTLLPNGNPSMYLYDFNDKKKTIKIRAVIADISIFNDDEFEFYTDYLHQNRFNAILFTGNKPNHAEIANALQAEGFLLYYQPAASVSINGLELINGVRIYDKSDEEVWIDVSDYHSLHSLKEKLNQETETKTIVLNALPNLLELERKVIMQSKYNEKF